MVRKLIPEVRMAVISLSSDRRPKVIRAAIKTAIGTARATIQARFRNRYSRMVSTSMPLPRKRSIARNRKLVNRIKTITSRAKKKGMKISFSMYRVSKRMVEITHGCSDRVMEDRKWLIPTDY